MLLIFAAGVPVAAAAALPDRFAIGRAAGLKAGQFLWDETDTGTGPVAIMVSIDRQHLYVWRGEALIGISTVSTGKPGKATPLGEFRILQKNVHHRSNLYSNAPMPYMQRLTWTGIAIHGGELPGYPASHGCIRVPLAFAKLLFAATDMGGVVSVSDGQSGPFLRIEADIASLSADAAPSWDATSAPVRMAQAAPVAPIEAPASAPRATSVKPSAPAIPVAPRLTMAPVALAQADLATPPLPPTRVLQISAKPEGEPSAPHWRVPYYGAAQSAGQSRSSE
ncbi:L,D-transpeptidase family protein [Sphingobium algorifonticola]|uniref:L,D-transpeptidase family protein n=1 Tax=Sphingobium algorifonticola TaxID=2008318 RepID=UPI001F49C617|nr:L,D-transpeptidase family protein [Sphingobium algorifonticola]